MQHILDHWPTLAALAADLGKPYQTIAAWKQRGRIPADYDLDLIEAASKRGFALSLEELASARRLVSLHAPSTGGQPPADQGRDPAALSKRAGGAA